MSPILLYYTGQGTDTRGRTLDDTQRLDHNRMEYIHDFIQWMFPLPTPSAHNPSAPILNDDDVIAFHQQPQLQHNLQTSFIAFLHFLGLAYQEGQVVEIGASTRRDHLFKIPNHNWLRITRVLLSLKTLGLDNESRAFFAYLQIVHQREPAITPATFSYWHDAAKGIAH